MHHAWKSEGFNCFVCLLAGRLLLLNCWDGPLRSDLLHWIQRIVVCQYQKEKNFKFACIVWAMLFIHVRKAIKLQKGLNTFITNECTISSSGEQQLGALLSKDQKLSWRDHQLPASNISPLKASLRCYAFYAVGWTKLILWAHSWQPKQERIIQKQTRHKKQGTKISSS